MNITNLQVKHITLGTGVVTEQTDSYVTVSFSSKTTKFVFPDAFEKFLTAIDTAKQSEITKLIEEKKKPPVILPEPIIDGGNHDDNDGGKKQPVLPPHRDGKRRTFYVFQGKTFQREYRGGYMWAPITNKVGTVPHHWARMTEVRKGDIIFHGCNGYIQAISVEKGSYYECPQPKELVVEDMWDRDGRRIDCDYTYLNRPVKPSEFAGEISKYSGIKYSPFKSDGSGNMGYLFDLRPELAKLFLEAAANRNNILRSIDYINEFMNQ